MYKLLYTSLKKLRQNSQNRYRSTIHESFESPLLYSGTTLAFFHYRGKCALLVLALQMLTIMRCNDNSLQLMPSSIVALVAGIFRSCL